MINIGQCIKAELERQERSVSWLARKLNVNRAAVYRIFGKNIIYTGMLANISLILRRNFFRELSEEADRRCCAQNDTRM